MVSCLQAGGEQGADGEEKGVEDHEAGSGVVLSVQGGDEGVTAVCHAALLASAKQQGKHQLSAVAM